MVGLFDLNWRVIVDSDGSQWHIAISVILEQSKCNLSGPVGAMTILDGYEGSRKAFDHEKFFGEMKSKLEPLASYYQYDGNYWKENEYTTGFNQTVRPKHGLYRRDLAKLENWPAGSQIIEFTSAFISMVQILVNLYTPFNELFDNKMIILLINLAAYEH